MRVILVVVVSKVKSTHSFGLVWEFNKNLIVCSLSKILSNNYVGTNWDWAGARSGLAGLTCFREKLWGTLVFRQNVLFVVGIRDSSVIMNSMTKPKQWHDMWHEDYGYVLFVHARCVVKEWKLKCLISILKSFVCPQVPCHCFQGDPASFTVSLIPL